MYSNLGVTADLSTTDSTHGAASNDGFNNTDTLIEIDELRGSDWADNLTGADGRSSILRGGKGNDTLTAGSGPTGLAYDRDYLNGGTAGVTVNLSTHTATDGFGNTDTLVGTFASVVGTKQNDNVTGDAGSTTFVVTAGTDTYYTGGGGDLLDFGAGYDLRGVELVGADLQFSYAADQTDTPVYALTIVGHTVAGSELNQVRFNFNDTLTTFDVAQTYNGSSLTEDTVFAGTSGADTITGGSGDDIILSNAGADTISGGAGDDMIIGGAGADQLDGGENGLEGDTIAFFSSPHPGVIVDLSSGTANDGFGATDTITGFENVKGSDYSDTITGDGNANKLAGENGADTISGGGGADIINGGTGSDNLTGGSGSDRFVYQSASDSSTGSGIDTITDFTAGAGGDQFDFTAFINGTVDYQGSGAFLNDGSAHAYFDDTSHRLGVDTNGDMQLDMEIQLNSNVTAASITADNFVDPQHQV